MQKPKELAYFFHAIRLSVILSILNFFQQQGEVMAGDNKKIKSMDLSWIVVSDLKKAIKYYESIGLRKINESPEHGWAEMMGEEGGSTLGLAQQSTHSPIKAGENAVTTLTIDDLAAYKKKLGSSVKFIGEAMEVPGHVKLQLCEDPDGNKFQLVQVLYAATH
jgi:predicted enzyme related to lactoylglutathione lyase